MRMSFWNLFRGYPDGSVEPVKKVRVGGVEFGPGVRFAPGVSFSGIDLTRYLGRDLEVIEQGDVSVVTGIYG